jgi:hypothetical protein
MKSLMLFSLCLLVGSAAAESPKPDSTNGWGYKYDSLLEDLAVWKTNPHVKVDSIGASVENRAIWMLTITDSTDSVAAGHKKHRIFIHARTHPGEVQVNWVADEAIRLLLDTTAKAAELRHDFIFHIIPMYNPDGVEDGHKRLNAHLVDLESNWDKSDPEPEVKALRKEFQSLMAGSIPVEVALNLHSDSINCTRFFFFHEAGGTSTAYAEMEKKFIDGVRAYFPVGIENWFFVQSWPTAPQARYPEGYWWLNHGDKVMALTYEDANCPGSGKFDSTARALVFGSVDYIRTRASATYSIVKGKRFRLSRRDGGLLLAGAPRAGRLPWALAAADGRLLAGGVLEDGAAFIPALRAPFQAAWLLLYPGKSGEVEVFPVSGPIR